MNLLFFRLSPAFLQKTVETLDLRKKLGLMGIAIQDSHGIVRFDGCYKFVSRFMDCLQMPGCDESSYPNDRKVLHIPSLAEKQSDLECMLISDRFMKPSVSM